MGEDRIALFQKKRTGGNVQSVPASSTNAGADANGHIFHMFGVKGPVHEHFQRWSKAGVS